MERIESTMKKKIIILVNLIGILLITMLCTKSLASTEVDLVSSKNKVEIKEEFSITVNANNTDIAAYTIWLYFDSDKVECISTDENINVADNRVIYTWISDTGTNIALNRLIKFNFKAKQNGIASFAIIGEFYNQKGEKIDIKYNQAEVEIGENNTLVQSEAEGLENTNDDTNQIGEQNTESSVALSADNAKLRIMRLNEEGVNPNFDPSIKEYYLVVGEDTQKLEITAIPENTEAEVVITGNENLKSGLNQIKIAVTSKDKSNTEEYTINVTRTNNEEAANADLETLAVADYTLSPEYQANITNYEIEVSNSTEELTILAIPQNEKATVEVAGNTNLKIGQNQIVVTVTAEDGVTSKKYLLNVYRRNQEEEIQNAEEEQNRIEEANEVVEEKENENMVGEAEKQNEEKVVNTVFSIVGTLLGIVVIGIVVIRIRKKI